MLRKNDRGLLQAVQKPCSQGPSVFRKVKKGVEKIRYASKRHTALVCHTLVPTGVVSHRHRWAGLTEHQ